MGNNELHRLYEERLAGITDPSFGAIRDAAKSLLFERFTKESRDVLWSDLDRGTAIIDREELLWQYLLSFGQMHESKMHMALARIRRIADIVADGYSVIDWGCGQGLATVCLLDFLKGEGTDVLPERTVLVDPSRLAIENARLHLELYGIDDARLVCKRLDDVLEEDIETDTPVTIHLFSNILDVKGFDLKRLARLIGDSARGDHYLVCVSPINAGVARLDAFRDYFIDAVGIATMAESLNDVSVLAQESYETGQQGNFTLKLLVFKFVAGRSSVVQVEYYPPVQFFAAYQLDSVADGLRVGVERDKRNSKEAPAWTAFDVAAPFELGGHVYDDVPPVFAVLNNIVTRGLPTKCSPFVEEAFEPYGETAESDKLGSIRFSGHASEDKLKRFARLWTPVGIARIQKTILEAIICRKLSLDMERWRVLVRERDVPCAALAIEDLRLMMSHLSSLTEKYGDCNMPEVDLTIVGNKAYENSPLHLNANVVTEVDEPLKSSRFDMVLDVSTASTITEERLGFSEYRARNRCYFVIGSTDDVRRTSVRHIYTSDTITYLPLGEIDQRGNFEENAERVNHLTYFLNLLFRKRDFRPGQVPILNRALQNKNVIGLLPTGGGKSLTYQLAAMLQPGVTVVIDPLRSLMLDQYQGLIEVGIDACSYINSTLTRGQRQLAEKKMESSQLQFVFLSPERLCIYEFRKRLQTMHDMNVYFAYGVIDEVHCVSEWGHDFRFSYLHLGRNMYNFVHTKNMENHLTLFGLTATASFDVLADVERELSGAGAYPLDANTVVRYENTDRLELQYKVDRVPVSFKAAWGPDLGSGLPKPRYINEWAGWDANLCKSAYLAAHLLEMPNRVVDLQSEASVRRIRQRFAERQNIATPSDTERLDSNISSDMFAKRDEYDHAGIVFCPHRRKTGVSVDFNREALEDAVADIGTFVGSSADDDKSRDEESFRNLELFKANKQSLMIATKAFGMGIDKPNVRFTVNMNYPSSLEGFVQEAGRAGRDRMISLATILVSDYTLARISPNCPIGTWPLQKIKGLWYTEEDLASILAYFGVKVPEEYLERATPEDDWVLPYCSFDSETFQLDRCSRQCDESGDCLLMRLPGEARRWCKYRDLEELAKRQGIPFPRTGLRYLNADYGNNMFFFNSNFPGERVEKRALNDLFCRNECKVSLDVASEDGGVTHTVSNLVDTVLGLEVGQKLVAFIKYNEKGSGSGSVGYSDAHKAIYRACCIGFIDDFTQDYVKKQFRLVMERKADGGYYEGLRQFLMRYYADERANELVAEVPSHRGQNEVQKCLGYLTEFIYGKVAVKRKRALDDIRAFCAMGIAPGKDWKETNEDLKDFIYYYFNSKYARDEYRADTGEDFSLTSDTNRGKESDSDITLKYLRVVDDDLVGAGGTPIDNVKHLQGAVRLIRRSLTDSNPCLALLNHFCLTQLGTNGSEVLERELSDDYLAGMTKYSESFDSKKEFWLFKREFDKRVIELPHRYDSRRMKSLQDEVTAQIHLAYLREIRHAYAGHKRKQVHHE